jgi:hypothetical protein
VSGAEIRVGDQLAGGARIPSRDKPLKQLLIG